MPRVYTRKPLTERLWPRVDRSGGPNACWEWKGSHTKGGYGTLVIGGKSGVTGKTMLAHRLAWELTNGPIPKGIDCCHKCDNPPCCNPAHLFLGTRNENMRDATSKGRLHGNDLIGNAHYMRQKTHCRNGHAYTEANTCWLADGTRQCRACRRGALKRWKASHPDHLVRQREATRRYRAKNG